MAKKDEQKLARHLYVVDGKTAKECAELVNVSEKTMGTWVDKFGWKNERDALIFSAENRITNIKEIISNLAEQHLKLMADLKEAEKNKDAEAVENIRSQMASISDEAAKWNKSLENLEKASKISLAVRLTVMQDIFHSLNKYDSKLFLQTIEFQEKYIHEISAIS